MIDGSCTMRNKGPDQTIKHNRIHSTLEMVF